MTIKRRLTAGGMAGALALTGLVATSAGATWAIAAENASDPQIESGGETPGEGSASVPSGLVDRIVEALAGLVEDGTITSDQASAVAQTLASSDSMRGGPRGGGPHGGKDEMGGMHLGLTVAAETLEMTEDELRTALSEGSTLAEIAETQGVAVDDLVDALVAAAEERLAETVTDGRITQARADEMAATLPERVAEQVERSWEPRGPGRHHGHSGDAPQQPDDSSAEDPA